jgi:hypothetical protein
MDGRPCGRNTLSRFARHDGKEGGAMTEMLARQLPRLIHSPPPPRKNLLFDILNQKILTYI